MIRSQAKMIDDLENCYNGLARSLIKHSSFFYNSDIPVTKEEILNFTAKILAESLEPLTDGNDATMTIEEVGNRLMRMEDANLSNDDDVNVMKSKIHNALKDDFEADKRTDTYWRI